MEFKIDNDVPIPVNDVREKYPFKHLRVGESALLPMKVQAQLSSRGKKLGMVFKSQKSVGGLVRVWRVS